MIILASCTTTVKNEQITAANSRPNESSIHAAIDSLIYKYGASNTLPIEKGGEACGFLMDQCGWQ